MLNMMERRYARPLCLATLVAGAFLATSLVGAADQPRQDENARKDQVKGQNGGQAPLDWRQPQVDSQRKPRATPRKIENLLARLKEMEARATSTTLEECNHWAKQNRRYQAMAGLQRQMRQGEFDMNEQCRWLYALMNRAHEELDTFRELFQHETGQMEFVGELVAKYADLQHSLEHDEPLARQFAASLELDAPVHEGLEQLRSFIGYLADRISLLPEMRARLEAFALEPVDEIEELDGAMRRLINREYALDEADFEQLTELTHFLERLLADPEAVPLDSGRYRMLIGTLDGARAIILRRLRVPPASLEEQSTDTSSTTESADEAHAEPEHASETAAEEPEVKAEPEAPLEGEWPAELKQLLTNKFRQLGLNWNSAMERQGFGAELSAPVEQRAPVGGPAWGGRRRAAAPAGPPTVPNNPRRS